MYFIADVVSQNAEFQVKFQSYLPMLHPIRLFHYETLMILITHWY